MVGAQSAWRRLSEGLRGCDNRNSEIYNHKAIKAKQLAGVKIVKGSKSDSAIIGHLYQVLGDTNDLWNVLDGIFACVLFDEASGTYVAARDPIGICPLYWGKDADGGIWFASEMKALQDVCTWFEIFPPVRARLPRIRLQLCRYLVPHLFAPVRVRQRRIPAWVCLPLVVGVPCGAGATG